MVSCVFSIDSIRSLRCVSRNPCRSAVSLYSSRAIMLTGPICSMRCFRARQVSSSAASSSPPRRAISASSRNTCASTLTSARQLASRYSRSECSLASSLCRVATILAQLVQRGALGLELGFKLGQLMAQSSAPARQWSASAPMPRHALRSTPSAAPPARAFSFTRCSRSFSESVALLGDRLHSRSRSAKARSMRWKAASAPRRRSSRPASSAVTCAASCCNPSRLLPHLVELRLQRVESRFSLRALCFEPRRLLALLGDGMPFLASHASLLRAACDVHSCSRRSMRCASPSICSQRCVQVGRLGLRLAPLGAARL